MRVLLTGGSGFIGSVLTGYLLDYPIEQLTIIDNLMYSKTSLLQFCGNDKFRFVNGDVRDSSLLLREVRNHDLIIPLAALVGAPLCDRNPIDAKLVNYEQIKNICDNKSSQQMVLGFTSNSGYGITDGKTVLTEKDPLNPISLYGKTKVDAENCIKQVDNHVTFRLATVFGTSTRPRTDLLVNNLVMKAVVDKVLVVYEGHFMRNYIHINDVCRAVMFVIDNWDWKCRNETYNVGNDDLNMSKLQLCQTIKKYLPVDIIESQYTKDVDKRNYIVSSKKIYDKGFGCKYTLDQGIKELIVSYSMINNQQYANY